MKTTAQTNNSQKGFTLIELLIVIAVLGVLATVLLVAINPLEQLARGRDSGRISDVSQLAHAVQAYATANADATFPVPVSGSNWQDVLKASGDIQNLVTAPSSNTSVCAPASGSGYQEGNICYNVVGTGPGATFVVWTMLESYSNFTKANCTAGSQVSVAVYDSSTGKAGVGCIASSTATPLPGITLY